MFQTYDLIWILILIEYKKADKKDIVCEFVSVNAILNINKEFKKKINATIPW